jgi:hypothetical protein
MQISKNLRESISWFTHSLIAGDLGPDDSRFSRDELFLKHPGTASQAMAVFLYNIEIDVAGSVEKYEEARERVREYILWKNANGIPAIPFSDDELGISRY